METPATQLAALILARLIEENLVRAEHRDQLCAALANGKLKMEDWRLAVELSHKQKGQP